MRLFLAVDLDDSQRVALGAAARSLGRALPGEDARAIKWVDVGNLHVTLHFLGEIPDSRVAALESALAPPLVAPGFDLGLGRAGVFPPRGAPRVVWVGITPGAAPLQTIHAEMAARLVAAGVSVDDRPFQAHVTIGRVKQPMRDDLRGAASGISIERAAPSRVEAVTLYRSILGSRGPTYEVRLRIPLGG